MVATDLSLSYYGGIRKWVDGKREYGLWKQAARTQILYPTIKYV